MLTLHKTNALSGLIFQLVCFCFLRAVPKSFGFLTHCFYTGRYLQIYNKIIKSVIKW